MDPQELMAMLGIKVVASAASSANSNGGIIPIPKGDSTKDSVVVETQAPKKQSWYENINAPQTALKLDKWDLQRGTNILCYKGESLVGCGLSDEALADFHAASYQANPLLLENTLAQRRRDFLGKLMETPEYSSLHTSTIHNEVASEVAAIEFAKQYADLCKKDERRYKHCKGKKYTQEQIQEAEESSLNRAIAKALQAATEEVESMEEACSALGLGPGNAESRMGHEKIAEVFERVKNSETLKRICEMAGKFKMLASSNQSRKVQHGYDDMVGITVDDDPSKLLAHEIGRLLDPDLELETLLRITSKQTMARQYQGVEKVGLGPIVICVDESGSMQGEPVEHAKGFALAMAYVAMRQRRWCALVGYSGGTAGTRCVLAPGKWDQKLLMDWLEHFFSGGTRMDVPLRELPTTYWNEFVVTGMQRGKTDVIIITDGIVRIPEQMKLDFLAWKQREQVRCISLILNHSAGDMELVSDETHLIKEINLGTDAVESCLSI